MSERGAQCPGPVERDPRACHVAEVPDQEHLPDVGIELGHGLGRPRPRQEVLLGEVDGVLLALLTRFDRVPVLDVAHAEGREPLDVGPPEPCSELVLGGFHQAVERDRRHVSAVGVEQVRALRMGGVRRVAKDLQHVGPVPRGPSLVRGHVVDHDARMGSEHPHQPGRARAAESRQHDREQGRREGRARPCPPPLQRPDRDALPVLEDCPELELEVQAQPQGAEKSAKATRRVLGNTRKRARDLGSRERDRDLLHGDTVREHLDGPRTTLTRDHRPRQIEDERIHGTARLRSMEPGVTEFVRQLPRCRNAQDLHERLGLSACTGFHGLSRTVRARSCRRPAGARRPRCRGARSRQRAPRAARAACDEAPARCRAARSRAPARAGGPRA